MCVYPDNHDDVVSITGRGMLIFPLISKGLVASYILNIGCKGYQLSAVLLSRLNETLSASNYHSTFIKNVFNQAATLDRSNCSDHHVRYFHTG